MNIVVYDTPVFWLVTLLMLYALARYGYGRLILAMHSAVTFGAQFSFVVNWTFGKVLPIFAIPYALRRGRTGLGIFSLFIVYVFFNTLIQSAFWNIPMGVKFPYGEGRFIVQLFNIGMLVIMTRATVFALSDHSQIRVFWKIFTYALLAHGLASLYQLIAGSFGLPLLGISRPFDLAAAGQMADVARFGTDSGQLVYRPGGLAGEPKGMAVLYAVYMTGFLFGGSSLYLGRREVLLSRAVFLLALLGFIAAFSTSAFLGIVPVALICLHVWGVGKFSRIVFFLLVFLVVSIPLWAMVSSISLDYFAEIMEMRTTGRLSDDDIDPPIAASLQELSRNPLVAMFGTGAGGSSFLIMRYLNEAFDYAYAPNVGFVLILVEHGVVGLLLLVVPYGVMFMKAAKRSRCLREPSVGLLCAMSISTFVLCLVGSGYPFGYPLAIAAVAAARRLPVRKTCE